MKPKSEHGAESIHTSDRAIFVRGLGKSATDDDLKDLFSDVGPIRRAFVVTDKEAWTPDSKSEASKPGNRVCRGYGFVQFALKEDADKASYIKKNVTLHGKKLIVEPARRRQRKSTDSDDHDDEEKAEADKDTTRDQEGSPSPARMETKKRKQAEVQCEENDPQKHVLAKKRAKVVHRESGTGKEGKLVDNSDHNQTNVETGSLPKRTIIVYFIDKQSKSKISAEAEQSNYKIQKLADRISFVQSLLSGHKEEVENISERGYFVSITCKTYLMARRCVEALHGKSRADASGDHSGIVTDAIIEAFPNTHRSRLIVRNLPFKARVEDVRKLFEPCGPIKEVSMPKSAKGKPAGFCFVEFFLPSDSATAVQRLNGTKLRERVIAVDVAVSKAVYAQLQDDKDDPIGNTKPGRTENSSDLDCSDSDSDAGSDGDEKEDSDSDSGSEDGKPKKPASSTEEELGRTLFVRNLLFETSKKDLFNLMAKFGKIEQCVLVMDKITGKPRGTAFVRFHTKESHDAALRGAKYESYKDVHLTPSDVVSHEHGLMLDGRFILLFPALNRAKAKESEDAHAAKTGKRKEDKRNLWLAWEGHIDPKSEAGEGLTEADLEKRRKAEQEKRKKLGSNPNIFVSTTRLCVRNLPKDLSDSQLRELCIEAAKASDQIENFKTSFITQVKVVRDTERQDHTGVPRSKGYGFVELKEHKEALGILRMLNNNPLACQTFLKSFSKKHRLPVDWKGRRLIVEFALEDKRKLQILDRTRQAGAKIKAAAENGEEEEAKDEAAFVRPKSKYEKIIDKRNKRKVKKMEQGAGKSSNAEDAEEQQEEAEDQEMLVDIDENDVDEALEFNDEGEMLHKRTNKSKKRDIQRPERESSENQLRAKRRKISNKSLPEPREQSKSKTNSESHAPQRNGPTQEARKSKFRNIPKDADDDERKLSKLVANYHHKLMRQGPSESSKKSRWYQE